MGEKLNRVWLLLVKVRAIGENSAALSVGSEALVQVFVPANAIEFALKEAEAIVSREGFRQEDVLSAKSFDSPDDASEMPEFVRKDISEARTSGTAFTGTFFTSETSAEFES